MKALLLAAGLGTRLKPITNYTQKCLVPINGKPLIEYWLENLSNVGVQHFLINTHYFKEQMEQFVLKSKFKDKITLVYEEELLNTGGTILKNKSFFDKEPFFVVHADNLSFCDFKEFIKKHKISQHPITMMTFLTDNPSSCGIVELDEYGIVRNFFEKIKNPPTNLANGAVYIFDSKIFDFLENLNKERIDISTEVLPNFIGQIATFHNDVYHRDIGTIESYALSQVEILKIKLDKI